MKRSWGLPYAALQRIFQQCKLSVSSRAVTKNSRKRDMSEAMQLERAPELIEWRDSLAIGVEQVDSEHRHLFELMALLDIGTVVEVVAQLKDYVATHFAHEELLMKESAYPGYEQHLKLHHEFAAQVEKFLAAGTDWNEERVEVARHFLSKWLTGHIMAHDLRFGQWHASRIPATPPVVQTTRASVGFLARLFGSK